jgi:hypothetical protein
MACLLQLTFQSVPLYLRTLLSLGLHQANSGCKSGMRQPNVVNEDFEIYPEFQKNSGIIC